MVAFTYTKTASRSELQQEVKNIETTVSNTNVGADVNETQSLLREINEVDRQLNMSVGTQQGEFYRSTKASLTELRQQVQEIETGGSTTVRRIRDDPAVTPEATTASSSNFVPTNTASTNNTDNTSQNNDELTNSEVRRLATTYPATTDTDSQTSNDTDNAGGGEDAPVEPGGFDDVPVAQGQYVLDVGGVGTTGPKPNKLHVFATHTYGLSLHYLTLREYNALVTGKVNYAPKPQRVIIASGGRRNERLVRNPIFNLDLFITELKMVTVIGQGGKGTNSIKIEFTVVEPIGARFLENLVELAVLNNFKNWIEMPLILQIDFFGLDDDGNYAPNPIDGITKYINFKLTDMRFEITARGSEYKCIGIPYSHVAYMKNNVAVPTNFEITAKTVGEFFRSAGGEVKTAVASDHSRDEFSIEMANAGVRPKGYPALSFPDALNQYQKKLVEGDGKKKYQDTADEYNFVIDPEIAKADLFVVGLKNTSQSPAQNDVVNKDTQDRQRGVVAINAGTNIIEVINDVIKPSAFYRNQTSDNANANDKDGKPIWAHKITTNIEFTDDYDEKRNQYRKKITYYVTRVPYHNDRYPNAEMSVPTVYDKYYYYSYTGKNQDVRDLKIEFKALFFQAITAFETQKSKDDNTETDDVSSRSNPASAGAQSRKQDSRDPFRLRTVPQITSQNANQLSDTNKRSIQASDLWNSVFNRSGGDMVTLTLEIAGDPDYIKQDDVFLPPKSKNNSSLPFDSKPIYLYLELKIPTDMNLETGLYTFEEKNSSFSGVYRVVTVENLFKDGAFVQKLTTVRVLNQKPKTEQRSEVRAQSALSSTSEGLPQTDSQTEDAYDNAALQAYNERNQTGKDSVSSDDAFSLANQEPQGESAAIAATAWREWETSEATEASDLGPGG